VIEYLIGAALSLMLGLAAGVAIRRLEEARGWDLAPFFRGAIVGSFVALPVVVATLDQESLTNPNSGDRHTALVIIGAGFAVGGVVEALRS
jgi:peptidoglycan/LPS O-acetylase OafA/YrhL